MIHRRFPAPAVPLPAAFVASETSLLGREAADFLTALEGQPTRALRANEHKTSLPELAARLGIVVDPVPWALAATYLHGAERLGGSVEHRAGLFYLQEPSAMAVVEALEIEPHDQVLDVAAGPGGKSTQASSKLGDDGLLVVNEVVSTRLGPLLANLDAWGYPNTATASM